MSGPAPQEAPAASEPPKRSRLRALLRNPFFWGAVAGLVGIPAIRPLLRHVPEPLPVLFDVPRFALVDQQGRPFGSDQLAGQTYVACFFFTRCPSICPGLTRGMKRLQDRFDQWREPVRLVSITVDPTFDTPAILAAYAKRYGADPARWRFLTGPEAAIRALIQTGFKSEVGKPRRTPGGTMDIVHTGYLALVDGKGRLRGIFRPEDPGLDELFHRAMQVRREGR